MSEQKYIETRAGGLVPLAGKSFQRFPSGLVRCSQDFICTNAQADILRYKLKSGLPFPQLPKSKAQAGNEFITFEQFTSPFYIFPDPGESYDIPGFCKFSVSGYSYEGSVGSGYNSVTLQSQIINLSKPFEKDVVLGDDEEPTEYAWTVNEKWRVDAAVYLGAIDALKTVSGVFGVVELDKRLLSRSVIGEVAPGGDREISISWAIQQVSVTRNNFGLRDEFSSTETYVPSY